MDDATFWGLISKLNWKYEGNDEKVVAPVVKALAALPEAEIAEFQNALTLKLYAIDGRAWARESGETVWWGEPDSLSEDGFLYSRCAVVANGPEFFDSVLGDCKQMPKDIEFEALLYVAPTAFERKTGRDGDEVRDKAGVSYETYSNKACWQHGT
jgi:hypothetical protein